MKIFELVYRKDDDFIIKKVSAASKNAIRMKIERGFKPVPAEYKLIKIYEGECPIIDADYISFILNPENGKTSEEKKQLQYCKDLVLCSAKRVKMENELIER